MDAPLHVCAAVPGAAAAAPKGRRLPLRGNRLCGRDRQHGKACVRQQPAAVRARYLYPGTRGRAHPGNLAGRAV